MSFQAKISAQNLLSERQEVKNRIVDISLTVDVSQYSRNRSIILNLIVYLYMPYLCKINWWFMQELHRTYAHIGAITDHYIQAALPAVTA